MNRIKELKSYMLEEEEKITIINNKIHILNYKDIGQFDSDKVVIKLKEKNVIIKGNDLVISKLLSNEVLITGAFNMIELR